MRTIILSILIVILSILSSPAHADSLWLYQGNQMNGCSCALTATLTLPVDTIAPQVAPISWDFTDGTSHLTQLNSTGFFYTPEFAGAPLFSTWTVILQGFGDMLGFDARTQFYGSATETVDFFGSEGNVGMHGVWSDPPAATPEPSTALLIAAGVVILLLRKVRIHL